MQVTKKWRYWLTTGWERTPRLTTEHLTKYKSFYTKDMHTLKAVVFRGDKRGVWVVIWPSAAGAVVKTYKTETAARVAVELSL